MRPVAEYPGLSSEQKRTLGYLLAASARSSESALLLVAFAQLWDCEPIVRSVAESSLKFSFLLQDRDDFERRHKEFSHDQFRVSLLKDHSKIVEFLNHVPDACHPRWRPLKDRLLPEKEYDEIAQEYPQARRRSLDSRWGFTGLLRELSSLNDPLFRDFTGLQNSYSIASHIMHADYIGVSTPLDIDRRTHERRNPFVLAHGVRLISDVMTFLKLRFFIGFRFIGQSNCGLLAETLQSIDKSLDDFRHIYEEWMAAEYQD